MDYTFPEDSYTMVSVLIVLCLLPYAVISGPLPRQAGYPYVPGGRIDEKGPHVNENFLNAFLGNVQSSGASNINSLVHEPERVEPDEFDDDKNDRKKGSDGKGDYEEDDFGYSDGYDNSYEVDHYDHKHKEDRYYKASINCREFHWKKATSPRKCSNVKMKDYEPDFDSRDKSDVIAICRWDEGFGEKNKKARCLCPRTRSKCSKKDQCYWYKSKDEKSKHGYDDDDEKDQKHYGECLHNSERFYNILARLLSKRGKKDFAIKIKYSSAAAKGEIPYGPWGPALIGHLEEPYRHSYGSDEYDHEDDYGNNDYGYGSYPQYGHEYDAYGAMQYSPSGYGHGGYENVGGYQGHQFPMLNYPHASDYLNVNQDYSGYTNYGTPYGFQGQVGYPQDMYQTVGGYSPGVNPSPYLNTHGPAVPSGPYPYETVQNNYIESPAYPSTYGENSYVPNLAYTASNAPEYPVSTPLVTKQASYEPPIVPTPGYRENPPYSVHTSVPNNYAYGGEVTYNPVPNNYAYGGATYNPTHFG